MKNQYTIDRKIAAHELMSNLHEESKAVIELMISKLYEELEGHKDSIIEYNLLIDTYKTSKYLSARMCIGDDYRVINDFKVKIRSSDRDNLFVLNYCNDLNMIKQKYTDRLDRIT